MSLLSLYSKIQLKIGKAEGEIRCFSSHSFVIPKRSEGSENVANTAGGKNTKDASNHALRSLSRPESREYSGRDFFGMTGKALWRMVTKLFLKLRLLFWKTAKVVVRFFALLFEDSSNNFLIFTRLDKDSVFVCNNSFCNSPLERGLGVCYKRFQKKVRFYSKTAFVGILICTIITTSVLYLFLPGKPSSFAKTYN